MKTAVSEKKAPPQSPGTRHASGEAGGRWQVHKPGEGSMTRLGAFIVALAFIIYSGHHWYYGWRFLRDFALKILGVIKLDFLLKWSDHVQNARYIAWFGAVFILLAGMALSYYYLYLKQKTSEFLVQTDGELRKVAWPKITPWFKPEAQVWGVTYVVLIVVLILALYVFGVDIIFQWVTKKLFYR